VRTHRHQNQDNPFAPQCQKRRTPSPRSAKKEMAAEADEDAAAEEETGAGRTGASEETEAGESSTNRENN
jgi:hypothetical protein